MLWLRTLSKKRRTTPCFLLCWCRSRNVSLGSFSNDNGKGKENVTWKWTLVQLWLFCDYPVLFTFYNVGEEPDSWIGSSAVKLNAQNSTFAVVDQISNPEYKSHFFLSFFVFVCCFIFRIRTSWVAFSLSLLRATNRICFKGVFSVPFYPKLWSATWKITVSGRFCYCLKSITFRNRFGFG